MGKCEMICAGFGGQGVLSLGMVVAYAGMYDGKEVSWLPSYGPEMRGGTANCAVVVSDTEVANPMVSKPDIVVAMNKPSVAKFVEAIVPGGYMFINSSLIDTKVDRKDINVVYVDTFKIAHDGGNPKGTNVVMLGAIVEKTGIITKENAKKAVAYSFKAKPKLIDINLKMFDLGCESVK